VLGRPFQGTAIPPRWAGRASTTICAIGTKERPLSHPPLRGFALRIAHSLGRPRSRLALAVAAYAFALLFLKLLDLPRVRVPAFGAEQFPPQPAVQGAGTPRLGQGGGDQELVRLQVGKDLKGDFWRKVQDGVYVEQGIQTVHNVGDGGGAQRAEDGVGELCTKLANCLRYTSRRALAAPFRLVHVDDPVREQRLGLRFVVAHPRVGPRLGVFGVAFVQAIGRGRGRIGRLEGLQVGGSEGSGPIVSERVGHV
jgi:hypothetical protein